MTTVNVLFSSVGRRVELIRAFRRAYEQLPIGGNIIGMDIDPVAAAFDYTDRHYVVPRVTSPDFIPAVTQICRQEQVDLLFPLIDLEVPVLSQNQEAIAATGARAVVLSPQIAAITVDKWRAVQFFRKHGVPAPQSWLAGQLSPEEATYPLFIKPRQGHSRLNCFKIDNCRQLEFFSEYVPDGVVQEYLPGAEITTDVMCDLEGRMLAIVSRQRIQVRAGEVAEGVTVHDPAIIEACRTIASGLSAIGPLVVQCIMKEGVAHFTEVNARLGGGIPLSFAAGADLPRWLLSGAAGLPVQPPPLGQYQVGLYMSRFDESCFFREEDRSQALRQGSNIDSPPAFQ